MNSEQFRQWRFFHKEIPLHNRPLIMGILNLTPDSFSDGGLYLNPDKAIKHVLEMLKNGADIIDVGGESSKPGAKSISIDEELSRVIPVIEKLQEITDVVISIDTKKTQVMQEAVKAGASMINDISALTSPASLAFVAKARLPVCLMHMKGKPLTMQNNPYYAGDIIDELNLFFHERVQTSLAAGIERENIILDPGIGFGKLPHHNLRIINQIKSFRQYRLPLMIGISRKSILGQVLNRPVHQRIIGGIASAVVAVLQAVRIVRTHDVDLTKQALMMLEAITREEIQHLL